MCAVRKGGFVQAVIVEHPFYAPAH